jgi:hypothetical protein
MPQAEILLRHRNARVADDQPPPTSRWSKETRRSGFFEMKSLSNRRCKENAGLVDDRRSTQLNRFATDDGAATSLNSARRSCRAQGVKLLVADALEVIEHAGKDIPRQCGLAGLVLGLQKRLSNQVRLEVEDVEPVNRLVV